MFVFLINRRGQTHIVDFYNPGQARYRAICGNVFFKKDHLITLAADNTFHGICITCRNYYDDMVISDLNFEPQMLRGEPHRLEDLLTLNKMGILGPEDKYYAYFKRSWSKLIRLRSLPNRHKKCYG